MPAPDGRAVLRVTAGREQGEFAPAALDACFAGAYRVSPQSDRMGMRLSGGPMLQRLREADMLSEAVVPGTVQVPPEGQPIVLLADAQTTGGYPRLGFVISRDLPLAGQLRPGDNVRFQPVTLREAAAEMLTLEAELRELSTAIACYAKQGE
nr:hypothetical protein [Paenibacillus turpanensis]